MSTKDDFCTRCGERFDFQADLIIRVPINVGEVLYLHFDPDDQANCFALWETDQING